MFICRQKYIFFKITFLINVKYMHTNKFKYRSSKKTHYENL